MTGLKDVLNEIVCLEPPLLEVFGTVLETEHIDSVAPSISITGIMLLGIPIWCFCISRIEFESGTLGGESRSSRKGIEQNGVVDSMLIY